MRILVDDSAAFNQGAGIGRYARNVVPMAARLMPEAHFRLLYAPEHSEPAPFAAETLDLFADPAQVSVRRLPFSRRRADQLWFRARAPLPAQVFTGRIDVGYSPDFTVPPVGRAPRAITVHDLAFEVCPWVAPEPLRRYLSAVVPRQVVHATRILAVSEATKQDLVERYGVDAKRIEIVPNGVDDRFSEAPPLAADERATLGIPSEYLLMVGTLEPRKNHRNTFAALRALDGRVDLPLVVAGRVGWDEGPILAAARPLVAAGRVILLDYVPERMLPGLYAGAAAVVYPSWYEGFGLPVAEGLAAGVPVVTGTADALRETGGELALYAEPDRPEEIATRIEEALAPDQQADTARERRRAWTRRYSWGQSGGRLAAALRRLAETAT